MMDLEQSKAEANRILSEAGWTTTMKPPWLGSHCAEGMVGGRTPDGTPYVKAYTAFPQDQAEAFDLDPADYPDEPHEAAAWLVEHAKARAAPKPKRELSELAQRVLAERNALASEATLATPTMEDADVRHPESEEAAPEAAADAGPVSGGASAAAEGHDGGAEAGGDGGGGALVAAHGPDGEGDCYEDEDGPAVWDADFAEPEPAAVEGADAEFPELEAPDLGAEIADAEAEAFVPSEPSRFYGLDDLDRRRSLRIGDVIRHAKTLMPWWSTDHHTEMVELRNFVMGVSERRWDDDPVRRERLEELEATRRRINQIEDARDAKVEFLEGASRAEVEAFDVEADWP